MLRAVLLPSPLPSSIHHPVSKAHIQRQLWTVAAQRHQRGARHVVGDPEALADHLPPSQIPAESAGSEDPGGPVHISNGLRPNSDGLQTQRIPAHIWRFLDSFHSDMFLQNMEPEGVKTERVHSRRRVPPSSGGRGRASMVRTKCKSQTCEAVACVSLAPCSWRQLGGTAGLDRCPAWPGSPTGGA